jgi:hypothetical protein
LCPSGITNSSNRSGAFIVNIKEKNDEEEEEEKNGKSLALCSFFRSKKKVGVLNFACDFGENRMPDRFLNTLYAMAFTLQRLTFSFIIDSLEIGHTCHLVAMNTNSPSQA